MADGQANVESQDVTGDTPVKAPKIPAIAPAVAEVLGQMSWLMLNSNQHRHLFVTDFEWLILPPLLRKQFRLVRQDDKPVAFVTWAYLGEEAEQRLLSGNRKLAPGEWAAKDGTPWIIDVVAPFGGVEQTIKSVIDGVFPGREVKVLTQGDGGFEAKTVTGAEAL